MADEIPELKPCPFCGGEAEALRMNDYDYDDYLYGGCKDLYCVGSEVIHSDEDIDRWNTRTPPKVKPLVWWSPSSSNNYTHGAETIFGTYYVGIDGGRHNAWIEIFHEGRRPIEQWFGEDRGYLEAAKSDAQKHYESRILSALE